MGFAYQRNLSQMQLCCWYIFMEFDKHDSAISAWCNITWWRHQMEKFSTLLLLCAGNSPVIGEFPPQRPVTRSFDVFFDLRVN